MGGNGRVEEICLGGGHFLGGLGFGEPDAVADLAEHFGVNLGGVHLIGVFVVALLVLFAFGLEESVYR